MNTSGKLVLEIGPANPPGTASGTIGIGATLMGVVGAQRDKALPAYATRSRLMTVNSHFAGHKASLDKKQSRTPRLPIDPL